MSPHALPSRLLSGALALLLLLTSGGRAEEKKPAADAKAPRIIMAFSLGLVRGEKARLTLRGIGLESANKVTAACDEQSLPVELKAKEKAELPKDTPLEKAGDSRVEVELTPPADTKADTVSISVVTTAGTSPPYAIRLFNAGDLIVEKEPNGGFATAQSVPESCTIRGAIGEANDVDVFRISGKAGQTLSADVFAARGGSMLDSLLTLYDQSGHIVAANDDAGSPDSAIHVPLPSDGVFYLSITDAPGKGGQTFPYLLAIRLDSAPAAATH